MSNKPKPPRTNPKPNNGNRRGWATTIDGFVRLVEHFGWPGALVIIVSYFVQTNATIEQKQAIIDTYILGKGISGNYPLLVMAGLGALLLLGQHYFWTRRTKVLVDEIERLSKWKSEYQEAKIGTELHHSIKP
jgi:hypothetical protein